MPQAVGIARTAVMDASNKALLESYRTHSDLILAYRWLATLDHRTCLVCAQLDGTVYSSVPEVGELVHRQEQAKPEMKTEGHTGPEAEEAQIDYIRQRYVASGVNFNNEELKDLHNNLRNYIGFDYHEYKEADRGNIHLSNEFIDGSKAINKFLDNTPDYTLGKDIYRGLDGLTSNLARKFHAGHFVKGDILESTAFESWTSEIVKAEEFLSSSRPQNVVISAKTNKRITSSSITFLSSLDEKELLVKKGYKFKILNITERLETGTIPRKYLFVEGEFI
jgi:hypothetical protein